MTERGGVFAVDRGVFSHPMFAPEPYTEREAWLWLVSAAAWKPMRVRVGRGAPVDLQRGQCAFAGRFMATKWKWPEARVRRFLNRLTSDAMVSIQTTRQSTHITICNYDKYAFGRRGNDAPIDAQIEAKSTHERRKEEELKEDNKEEKKESTSLRSGVDAPKVASRETFQSEWDQFYARYPHKVGKQAALKAFAKVMRAGVPLARILSALDRYIAEKPPDRSWCNPATWLNEGRYDDEPAKLGGKNETTGNVIAAADRLVARLAEFDRPAPDFSRASELRGGTGTPAIRLVSEG